MKYPYKFKMVILIGALLVACGQSAQATPPPSVTPLPTDTAPAATATLQWDALPTFALDTNALPTLDVEALPTFVLPDGTNIPFPTPNPKIPTLIPTIDPSLVADLLRKSISIQTLDGVNRHYIQQITGWDYGFRQTCHPYQWLDPDHLLVYPRTGVDILPLPIGGGSAIGDLSSKAMVINLTRGTYWLLSPPTPTKYGDCNLVYWAQELGIIINQENKRTTSDPANEVIVTYTFDGRKIAEYKGTITSVSPSGEKFLVGDNAIVNLRSNKTNDLTWHIDRSQDYSLGIFPNLYWSSDETQVYRCCFHYANLNTGNSYNFEWSDLRGPDGKPLPYPMNSPHTDGQWVRNDSYFLPKWSYMSYGGDPTVMFSPTSKNYYIIDRPEIRADTAVYNIAPNGIYVWITGYNDIDNADKAVLVNLNTFEATSYDISTDEFEWSPDGNFACVTVSFDNGSSQIHLLTVSSKKLELLNLNSCPSWRPNDHLLAYFTENNQVLTILDPTDMSVKGWKLPTAFPGLIWSPDGSQLALIAEDGSLWHVNYPKLDNFEQLTQPITMKGARDITWSSDSKSIAFIGGTDIYVVNISQ